MIKTVCGTSRIVSPAIWTSLVTRSMFAVSDLWPAFRAPFLVKSSCKISRERWLELAQLRIESWMWSELFAIYWAPMLVTRGTGPHPALSTNTHQEAICRPIELQHQFCCRRWIQTLSPPPPYQPHGLLLMPFFYSALWSFSLLPLAEAPTPAPAYLHWFSALWLLWVDCLLFLWPLSRTVLWRSALCHHILLSC